MALRKALLITDSTELRETVEVLLGREIEIRHLEPGATRPETSDASFILLDARQPGPTPSWLAADVTVLCIGHHASHLRRRLGHGYRELPAAFDAFALRAAVRQSTLRPRQRDAAPANPFLAPPFLTAEAAVIAAGAVHTGLPLLICGEAGTGKQRVARAIHAERGAAYFLSAGAAEVNSRRLPPLPDILEHGDEVTVVLGDLRDLDASGRRYLVDLLDSREICEPGKSLRAQIITTSLADPEELLVAGLLERELFYRIQPLALKLPPLRERQGDIPALVQNTSRRICASLDAPPVRFTDAAVRRLSRYLWFGNVAELESVLARTIAFATSAPIDKADLLFGYDPILPRLAPRAETAPLRPSSNGTTVDLVIHELAHEFKNPMVTIKTFAQHLDHIGEGDGGTDQMARLTEAAVERMDRALENLVQFTRFQDPARQVTPFASLITAALREIEPDLVEKEVQLEVAPSSVDVYVDPAQIAYALANLLRNVVRDVSPRQKLRLRTSDASGLEIEYSAAARSAAEALTRYITSGTNGGGALPLGLAFAKTLIERNGGQLAVDRESDPAKITIELPQGVEEERNGETQGTGR